MTIDDQSSRASGWYPDPMEQHESRFWDGSTWTEHVATQGVSSVSAPGAGARGVSVGGAAPAKHPAAGRAKSRAVLILIGGGLMAVGALLPWETVTASGTTIKTANGTSV